MNIIRVSNSLNPDQARHFVSWPDLDPNCLHRLSLATKVATSKVKVQDIEYYIKPRTIILKRVPSGFTWVKV